MHYNDEEAQLQMRFRRLMVRESPAIIISREFVSLLPSLVNIGSADRESFKLCNATTGFDFLREGGGGTVLPSMGDIDMCRGIG